MNKLAWIIEYPVWARGPLVSLDTKYSVRRRIGGKYCVMAEKYSGLRGLLISENHIYSVYGVTSDTALPKKYSIRRPLPSAQRTIDNSPAVYCWGRRSEEDVVRKADD